MLAETFQLDDARKAVEHGAAGRSQGMDACLHGVRADGGAI